MMLTIILISILGLLAIWFICFYSAIDQLTKSMDNIEILDNEEEFIDLFKNGLRNSCWNEYKERTDEVFFI